MANRAHRAAFVFALARCSPSRPRGDPGSEPNATDVCAIVTRALRSCLAASAARGVVVLDRGGVPSPLVIHASFPELSKHVSSSPLAPACRRPRTGAGRPSAVASPRSGTSTSGRMRGSSPTCTTSSRLLSVCATVSARALTRSVLWQEAFKESFEAARDRCRGHAGGPSPDMRSAHLRLGLAACAGGQLRTGGCCCGARGSAARRAPGVV